MLLKTDLKETEYKFVRVDSCGSRRRLVMCSSEYGNNEAVISGNGCEFLSKLTYYLLIKENFT